ncbi:MULTISPECIES: ABC transporter substrate-binding protein [Streptacidiphilus]|uniref:ABC transporter substrate-binding protein n=1 Tax=Streptacidiphilus cavernicola TaxID=3342716 RepID=A0ABV6UV92_9ACTN|nr:ABC transporter substrate-binding protein [Streptacidiphilus jeojiense]
MRRQSIVCTVTAVLAVVLAGCSSGTGSSGTGPAASGSSTGTGAAALVDVKVGVIPIVDVAPIYLGVKQGFFADQGLKLSLTTAQGGAAIVPGVVSGQFQFGFSNVLSLMLAEQNGVPIKAISNGVASTGVAGKDFGALVVKKGSAITSAKDLVGKKVAINTLKNINEVAVRDSVQKAGGDPSKVSFVELGFDAMPAALAKGQIDAALVVEPALATVKAQGATVIASPYVDVAPELTVAMYFTSTSYAQQHADVVKEFRTALAQSLAYADGHPDDVRAVLGSYTKIPADTLKQITLPSWPADVNRASLQTLGQLAVGYGLLTKAPDLDTLLP